MLTASNKQRLLDLPAEIRNQIYEFTCPCLNDKDNYCNPILSRRLANPPSFFCYRCPGQAFLRVCRQTRSEISPIFFGAHEFRFQLWLDHKPALESWFGVVSEDAINHVRRFRLHTQLPDETVDLARLPGTGSAMPGSIAVDLDGLMDSDMVASGKTWTQPLLEEPRKRVLSIVKSLPCVERKSMLTKETLSLIILAVGWFGTRNDRERQMVAQQSTTRLFQF